jgi:hypothetical protein
VFDQLKRLQNPSGEPKGRVGGGVASAASHRSGSARHNASIVTDQLGLFYKNAGDQYAGPIEPVSENCLTILVNRDKGRVGGGVASAASHNPCPIKASGSSRHGFTFPAGDKGQEIRGQGTFILSLRPRGRPPKKKAARPAPLFRQSANKVPCPLFINLSISAAP